MTEKDKRYFRMLQINKNIKDAIARKLVVPRRFYATPSKDMRFQVNVEFTLAQQQARKYTNFQTQQLEQKEPDTFIMSDREHDKLLLRRETTHSLNASEKGEAEK